jgi:hypothetical protein
VKRPYFIHAVYFVQRTDDSITVSITKKMQRYTVFFITVNAVHILGGFSAHQQELKTVHTASGIRKVYFPLPLAVAANQLDIYQMLCLYSFEILMMDGEAA